MADKPYDRGSKWLLENQGRALAMLGGLRDVVSCRSIQSELVQPAQLPDGLLEVRLRGRRDPLLLLIEFCTYPEVRTARQLHDDLMMVVQARNVVPEALALVLCPRGKKEVPAENLLTSELGWTSLVGRWKVIEVWTLSAEEMLKCPDVGVVPWVTLMAHDGPPEPLLRRCKDRIDAEGGDKRDELLAVTQIFMELRFSRGTQQGLFELFGGRKTMIEFPAFKRAHEEGARERFHLNIERSINLRFGKLSEDARARLRGVQNEATLEGLFDLATTCASKDAFLERLSAETTPAPTSVSSRRKKKS